MRCPITCSHCHGRGNCGDDLDAETQAAKLIGLTFDALALDLLGRTMHDVPSGSIEVVLSAQRRKLEARIVGLVHDLAASRRGV